MKSLVEVCREQRAENWQQADAWREQREAQKNNLFLAREAKRLRAYSMPTSRQRSSSQRGRAMELYRSGQTSREVADALGLSINSVRTWAKRDGIRGGHEQRAALAKEGK